MRSIEAIFGGVLALGVLGAMLFVVMGTSFSGGSGTPSNANSNTVYSDTDMTPTLTATAGQDLVCECYDAAFELAGQVDVLSPQYRTGFQQCRARGGVAGGDAWTAGWNARLSARPYEASCRAYRRRG